MISSRRKIHLEQLDDQFWSFKTEDDSYNDQGKLPPLDGDFDGANFDFHKGTSG